MGIEKIAGNLNFTLSSVIQAITKNASKTDITTKSLNVDEIYKIMNARALCIKPDIIKKGFNDMPKGLNTYEIIRKMDIIDYLGSHIK